MKICIPTSSGGHLAQVMALKPWWGKEERFFVAYPTPDARWLLRNEKAYFGHYPEHRHATNAVKNFFLALFLLIKERPSLVFSTGAGLAAPFFWAAWILRIPSLYLEPYDFVIYPSLTARLVSPFATVLLVQHESLRRALPNARVWGSIF